MWRCSLLPTMLSFMGLVLDGAQPQFDMDGGNQRRYEDGGSQLAQVQRESEHPRYGKCWVNALTKITEGCKRLTDDEQSRMALALANCHLEKAGFTMYPCDPDESISTCLAPMQNDVSAFNAYTEFFTHTQNICFFLQSQVWHQKTEQTVSKLAESSEVVVGQLEVTSHLQTEMMEKQNASIQNQKEILENEEYLREALRTSADSVKQVFDEMRNSTSQQKLLFEKTFERVTAIQKLILGEFTWIHSVLFYLASVVIVYLLTSTPRTAGARLWMFAVFALGWMTERALFHWFEGANEDTIYYNLWTCRKLFSLVAIVVLVICAYRYQDYNNINHKLLLELHAKIAQIGGTNLPMLGGPDSSDEADSITVVDSTAIGVRGPTSLTAISSPYNEENDLTFIPNKLSYSSDSDSDSYASALPGSRRPSRANTPSLFLSEDSTLNASMFNNTKADSSRLTIKSPDGDISVTVTKKGRPKGSRNRTSLDSALLRNTPLSSTYDLRSRRQTPPSNPVLNQETVDMFIRSIEGRRRTSPRRRLSPGKLTEIK